MEETQVPVLTTARLRALVPDPPATVRVQNLSTVLQYVGHDAWGRAGKPQPALISAEVAFAAPFSAAASDDRVADDTVHYGSLSKVILASLKRIEGECQEALSDSEEDGYDLARAIGLLWYDLTGLTVRGERPGTHPGRVPFLDLKKLRLLSLAITLPKASLLGEDVSLTASAVFEEGTEKMQARAMSFGISRLRVPTLIGVNSNERLAKQLVVVTATVEHFVEMPRDIYTGVEEVVVKVHISALIPRYVMLTEIGYGELRLPDARGARGLYSRTCPHMPLSDALPPKSQRPPAGLCSHGEAERSTHGGLPGCGGQGDIGISRATETGTRGLGLNVQ
jgi:dihydroneopterin aldolase